jgi:hypothetical protein
LLRYAAPAIPPNPPGNAETQFGDRIFAAEMKEYDA